MRLHCEDVRQAHRAADDERDPAVPHIGVLHAAHGLVTAAAAAEAVAVRAVFAVHLGGEDARVLRGGRAGAVPGDRAVLARVGRQRSEVRLDHVGAAFDGERDGSAHALRHATAEDVLGAGHGEDRLDEPAVVLLLGREVVREPQVGSFEAAVHVPVPHRVVTPLVDVHVRRRVVGIAQTRRRSHGAHHPPRAARMAAAVRIRLTPSGSCQSRPAAFRIRPGAPRARRPG